MVDFKKLNELNEKIKVFNIKSHGVADDDVYIGRPTALGNPFAMKDHNDDKERDVVVGKYEVWLREQYKKQDIVYKILHKLADQYRGDGYLNLVCYCAPKACHGDVVKKAVIGILYGKKVEEEKK